MSVLPRITVFSTRSTQSESRALLYLLLLDRTWATQGTMVEINGGYSAYLNIKYLLELFSTNPCSYAARWLCDDEL